MLTSLLLVRRARRIAILAGVLFAVVAGYGQAYAQIPYPPAPQPAPSGAPAPVPPPWPIPGPWPTAFQWPPPAPSAPSGGSTRPLLAPLVGPLAWQAEVRAVLGELISNLSSDNASRVRGVPLVFDPDPSNVNAFAGCDDNGAPFIAGTEGLLEAVDGIAQTQATDELYGTRTYDAYTSVVGPRLAQSKGGSAALPFGTIPLQYLMLPQRLSRAHEIFDEVVAFTFGHELSHHYLGHTGCARGQAGGVGPAVAALGHLITSAAPWLNQPNEALADNAGVINVLDTGKRRVPAYRWTERGGLTLLDFFARLERAAGGSPLNVVGYLQTHPNPAVRIPLLQADARVWWLQHPG